MSDRIMTLHPEGKTGVHISKEKYEAVREAILEAVREHGKITFVDLTNEVYQKLSGRFDGSIPWYVTTVKLDLEARGVLERVPDSSPQIIRISEAESS